MYRSYTYAWEGLCYVIFDWSMSGTPVIMLQLTYIFFLKSSFLCSHKGIALTAAYTSFVSWWQGNTTAINCSSGGGKVNLCHIMWNFTGTSNPQINFSAFLHVLHNSYLPWEFLSSHMHYYWLTVVQEMASRRGFAFSTSSECQRLDLSAKYVREPWRQRDTAACSQTNCWHFPGNPMPAECVPSACLCVCVCLCMYMAVLDRTTNNPRQCVTSIQAVCDLYLDSVWPLSRQCVTSI